MRKFAILLATAGLFASNQAFAADKPKDAEPLPDIYRGVLACMAVSDESARLSCYDSQVAKMDQAQQQSQLFVASNDDIKTAKRDIFGLSLPSLKIFGGVEEIQEIDSTITAISSARDGLPIYTIQEGARWKQTDSRNVYPKAGNTIKIKRSSLGGFMAQVDGRSGVRVIRLPD